MRVLLSRSSRGVWEGVKMNGLELVGGFLKHGCHENFAGPPYRFYWATQNQHLRSPATRAL